MKVFSNIACVRLPDEKRQKLDPKSEKYILTGYSLEQKEYKCFTPTLARASQDIIFNEAAYHGIPRHHRHLTYRKHPTPTQMVGI